MRSISQIREDFTRLSQNTTEDQLSVEKKKLSLISMVESKLRTDLQFPLITTLSNEIQHSYIYRTRYTKILYSFLLILGTIQVSARHYLFGSALIALIPNLSPSVIMTLSGFYVLLNLLLFYGFEVALLKNALGITNANTKTNQLISTHLEQIQKIKTMNQLLSNISALQLDERLYKDYERLIATLNQDLQKKYTTVQTNDNSVYRKTLTVATLGLATISYIASGYFLINTILKALAAPLIGTPVGFIIIFLSLFVDLGFYYAMGATGIVRMFNSDNENYKTLKTELDLFNSEQNHTFFKRPKDITPRFMPKLSRDAATQTEFYLQNSSEKGVSYGAF